MIITSLALELRILRTLTADITSKRLARLSATLNPACFYSDIGSEVYSRVTMLAKERGHFVKWAELLTDPVLKETTRKRLQRFKKSAITDRDDLTGQIKQLHNYRRLRAMWFAAEHTFEQLKRDHVDPDRLHLQINEKLLEASTTGDSSEWFTHIGGDDKVAQRFVKKLLNNKIREIYIPTGFRAFDARNIGIPRQSFFLVAAETSAGKSVLAHQVGSKMAEAGARVCIISLEMSNVETGQRHLSRIASINMNKIIDPTKISKPRKNKAYRRWIRWHKTIKSRGGLLSIFAPQEDLTIEQILIILKPFDYDVIIIDYIGLLKGIDEADYPRLLGRVARLGKRHAANTNSVVMACAQLSSEGILRYSRAMQEHAQNMWIWTYSEEERVNKIIKIRQPKSRNQEPFTFFVREDFAHMRMKDLNDKETRRIRDQIKQARQQKQIKGKQRFTQKKSKEIISSNDFADLN
jgi:replicative DNA helicase